MAHDARLNAGIGHADVCRRKMGGGCNCCPSCGDHRYAFDDRRCLTCHPPGKEAPAVTPKKQPAPRVKSSVKLLPIKPTGKSRAADALRREQLYREAMGLPMEGTDDITHA